MELQQALISYEANKWQIWISVFLTITLIAWLTYLTIVTYLHKGAKEFNDAPKKINIDDCQHEKVVFKVCVKTYNTEQGARTRCEALYKRHNVNAEVTVIFANEEPIKCFALDIWDFNK